MAVGIFSSIASDEAARAFKSLHEELAALRDENRRLRAEPVVRRTLHDAIADLRAYVAALTVAVDSSAGADHTRATDLADVRSQNVIDMLVVRDLVQALTADIDAALAALAGHPAGEGPA